MSANITEMLMVCFQEHFPFYFELITEF